MTRLDSGQEMLYKNQSKGNNSKIDEGRVMGFVHTPNIHCKKHAFQFGVIWIYGDKVRLKTRNALSKSTKGQ